MSEKIGDVSLVDFTAEALFTWNTPSDPYFVIRGRPGDSDEDDPYAPIVRAVLAVAGPIIAAQTLRDAASEVTSGIVSGRAGFPDSWLRVRADQIGGVS